MAPPPPVLMDEIVEEIVLRLPPDEPGALVRAAVACKSWCRLISNPRFHRRFREFHRSAPMLGFLLDVWDEEDSNSYIARFVPMSPSSFPPRADRRGFALDARHGRVLLYTTEAAQQDDLFLLDYYHFVVWNPIKDQQTELPVFSWYPCSPAWKAAVLCAGGAACDHLTCHDEPFLVLFVGIVAEYVYVYEYSSETGTWSGPTTNGYLGPLATSVVPMGPNLLAEGALYFAIEGGCRILRYDIAEFSLSLTGIPEMAQDHCVGNMVLVTTEDGKLGIAGVVGYKLYLWSVFLRTDNVLTWNLGRIIELDMMLSIDIGLPSTSFFVVGYAEGAGAVFVSASDGIYAAVLELGQVRKVHERTHFCGIVPYLSFYTPDIARSILPPSAHQ